MQNLSEREQQNAINEVRILASIHNENVISYKEAFYDKGSQSLCIIMEYANNGDLYKHIVKKQKSEAFFTENEIWMIFIQVVIGLNSLHKLNILHRDLKVR